MANEDLIIENCRWTNNDEYNPSRMGMVNNQNKFDIDYFDICSKTADYMDPSARILLELTVEAILDSGK